MLACLFASAAHVNFVCRCQDPVSIHETLPVHKGVPEDNNMERSMWWMIKWLTIVWLLLLLIGAPLAPESELLVAMLSLGLFAWVLLVSVVLFSAVIRALRELNRRWSTPSPARAAMDLAQKEEVLTDSAVVATTPTDPLESSTKEEQAPSLAPRSTGYLQAFFRFLLGAIKLCALIAGAIFLTGWKVLTIAWKVLGFIFDQSKSPDQGEAGDTETKEAVRKSIIIRPYLGGCLSQWWEFDGRLLKPHIGGEISQWWEFDGRLLKPHIGGEISQWWEFDGRLLKPHIGGEISQWWEFDGRLLKPHIGGETSQWWELDGVAPAGVLAKVLGII
jgi:hypothetical protein